MPKAEAQMKNSARCDPARMTSASRIRKRSIDLHGQKTSVSMEDAFWSALGTIAAARNESMAQLINALDRGRPPGLNLSSAIRLFVLRYYYRAHGAPSS
jgi:predicted DNA-binding ribbon-helix-helix protein